MARLGRLPLAAQPGERWLYHTPADVTAVLISRVVGQPLDDILRERIFAPLGMRDTGFHVPADKIGRLATGYMRTGDGLAVADPAGKLGAFSAAASCAANCASSWVNSSACSTGWVKLTSAFRS